MKPGFLSAALAAALAAAALSFAVTPTLVQAAPDKKPNIIVIWGDDIGINNISAYNLGVMGYKTPNIDRIAREGALFTDAYAQQSCTAGRASFILGQHPFRTGLLTIGMPGSLESKKIQLGINCLQYIFGNILGLFSRNGITENF